MSTTRGYDGTVIRKGDTVQCVEASHISWSPGQPGDRFVVQDTDGRYGEDGSLWLTGDDGNRLPTANAVRFVKVQPVDPSCDRPGHLTSSCQHLPDAEADGYSWGDDAESILREAHDAVYGSRQGDYGHPREDFTRTAVLWTGLLQHKLADGAFIEPEDIARCMVGVKLSRDVNSPKRDNRVDMAGYALCLDRLETGR